MAIPALKAAAIADVMNRHRVRNVVIGAYAAIAQHAPIPATRDIDFTPATSLENLKRLSAALKELDARIRTDAVEGGLPFHHDGRSLGASAVWNLVCPYGEFDVSFIPADLLTATATSNQRHTVYVSTPSMSWSPICPMSFAPKKQPDGQRISRFYLPFTVSVKKRAATSPIAIEVSTSASESRLVSTLFRWRHRDLYGLCHQRLFARSAHRLLGTNVKRMDTLESSCEAQLSDQGESQAHEAAPTGFEPVSPP